MSIKLYQHKEFNKNIRPLENALRIVCAESISLSVPKQFFPKVVLKDGSTTEYELDHTPSTISGEITISIKGLIRTTLNHEDFTRLFTYPGAAITGATPVTTTDLFESIDIDYGYLRLKNCQLVQSTIDSATDKDYVYFGTAVWKAQYIQKLTTVNGN
jgi:hypothetical protein